MEFNERCDMVYELLELLKDNKLNNSQKRKIYEIVKGFTNRTEKQKERFFLFYNLDEGENKNYRLCDLALLYNCTSGCIRTAIGRIRYNLIYSDAESLAIMKDILEEYHKNN
ncbi:MAG: hypothetical protein IJJ82_07230 [Clostridia bacterium]|nr:hypothetical protein [Clostridia bacterium]